MKKKERIITAHFLNSKEESEANLSLSVSKVKTFLDCKAKYRFCYIEKLPRKEWEFHVFGKYLHDILENFHKKLIEDPKLDLRSLMAKCFQEGTERFEVSLGQKKEAKDLLTLYLTKIEAKKRLANVIAVEKHFYVDIDGKVLLNGFIDRVQKDQDDVLHVADYKTTKNKKYLTDYFQLLTYAYVLMLEDPKLDKIRASYVLLRHDFEYITKEYSRDEVMNIGEKFIAYADEIHEEKLWRPNPQFLCRYCDYMESCPEGKSYLVKRKLISETEYGLSGW